MAMPVQLFARYGVMVILMGLLFSATWNAFRIGISEIYDALAGVEIDHWAKATGRVASEGNTVESYLSISHQFNSGNPSTSMNLGRMYEFRALGKSREENLQVALNHYVRASKLRPASSVSWAIIAEVKSQLGELDTEFEEALAQSVRFGPWEPMAQTLIVRTGLRNWSRLTANTRKLVRDTAIRGMLSQAPGQRRTVARILKTQGFLTLVCPHLPNSRQFSRYCKI